MNRDCEVIQDLISMGRKASRASTRLVTEHLRDCPSCRSYFQATRKGWRPHPQIHLPALPRNTQERYFRWSLMALAIMTAALCMLVNVAVEKRVTWGWIVAGAMVCVTLPAETYLISYTYRFLKALLSFSLLSVGMLGLIQYVQYNLMGVGGVWFWRVGVPVTGIWLTAVWLGILLVRWKNANGLYCLSAILFLSIPADIATEGVAVAYTLEPFAVHWLNLIACAVGAVGFGAMGAMFDARGKHKKG